MFIRSERLFLRPGWPEDAPDLARAIGDEAIVRNLARVPWPYDESHALNWLSLSRSSLLPSLLVTLPSGNDTRILGGCGLHDDEGEAALGYWIAREHWGRGYATEAVHALVDAARALGHRRIVARHFADNPASGRVLLKAGFRPSGEVRQRFSAGRGSEAPAIGYALDLGGTCDCDGDDEGKPVRMAA